MRVSRSAREWIGAGLLFLLTLAVFARATGFEFVSYDDDEYVTRNQHVTQGLTPDGIVWALGSGEASNWHPLTWMSHMLDVDLYGLEPAGHHATSVLLHAWNAVLVWLLFRRATGRHAESLAVAAFFALHPLRVESVAWIAERKDVLSAFFGLAAAIAWVAWARRPEGSRGKRAYGWALVLFAVGLTAKPMIVTLPVVLLAIDLGLLGRGKEGLARLLLEKLPFFALSAASSLVTFLVQRAGGSTAVATKLPFADRLAQSFVAPVQYLGKLFWPADLSVLYPHPYMAGGTPWRSWQWIGAGVLLLAISAGVLRARSRPCLAAGWFSYLVMLTPVVGIVQVGSQGIADRYTYLPLLGVTAPLVFEIGERLRRGSAGARRIAVAATCVLLAACSIATGVHLGAWRDSTTLFESSLAAAPDNPVLQCTLGNELFQNGKVEEAIPHYERAIALYPDFELAEYSLGLALGQAGRTADSETHLRRAVELDPRSAAAHSALGFVLAHQGNFGPAIEEFELSLKLDPTDATVRGWLEAARRLRKQ
jgi:hypothetical protein